MNDQIKDKKERKKAAIIDRRKEGSKGKVKKD